MHAETPLTTIPSAVPAAACELRVLGYPTLHLDGVPFANALSAKALALLIYLSIEKQRQHSREELATLLWPEAKRGDGLASLRQTLFLLRKALPTSLPPLLQSSRQSVGLNPAAILWLDVTAFSYLLSACQGHAHRRLDACPACMARMQEAVALYRGNFLAGFSLADSDPFESWQTAQKEFRSEQMLAALSELAAFHTRRQEYPLAIGHLQRGLVLVPWDERGHRRLMRVLALDGQRSAALHQYELCRQHLAADLNALPSAETTALRDQIEASQWEVEQMEASNPYRGLLAFDEGNAQDFYGREEIAQRLLAAVQQQPLVTVLGGSGSGKTSLIYAGLLPRLRGAGLPSSAPASPQAKGAQIPWTVIDFSPTDDPFAALAAALSPLLSPPVDATHLAAALRRGERSLAELTAALAPPPRRLLIVVDAFEEIYSLCPDPVMRQAFLDLLLAPVDREVAGGRWQVAEEGIPPIAPTETNPNPQSPAYPFTLLLSLRADFTTQALSDRALAEARQRGGFIVRPMDSYELQQAVEQPALSRGVGFESGLIERLLVDVGRDPGNLPLLQFCLTQLWSRQQAGALTHAAYDDIGGLAGGLSLYADRVFEQLKPDEQSAARQILLRLIQPGEGTDDTRRWASRQELGEIGWGLVQHLAAARLLVTDRNAAGQQQAALAHEALIQHWERLQVWLRQDRAWHLWQHRLSSVLQLWEASGHDPSALLRGTLLAEAEEWQVEHTADLSAQERSFTDASIAQRQLEEESSVADRQQEMILAQSLAEMEARIAGLVRWRAISFGLIGLLALLAALLALW